MKAGKRERASQCNKRKPTTTLLENRRESAEESHHEPGDQETPVDRNGRARVNPREADVEQQVWREVGQEYKTKGWSTTEIMEGQETTRHLGCFLKGNRNPRVGKMRAHEDDESDEEPGHLVCNMTGQRWEKLPFPYYNRFRSVRLSNAYRAVQPYTSPSNSWIRVGRILQGRERSEDS